MQIARAYAFLLYSLRDSKKKKHNNNNNKKPMLLDGGADLPKQDVLLLLGLKENQDVSFYPESSPPPVP